MTATLSPKSRVPEKEVGTERYCKRGVQCYNCQKYRHIAKECFQRKKPRTPQPGPSTQARKTHQGEESDDEAKEQANVVLRQMGEASNRVKGYVARMIGEGFRST